MGTEGRAEDTMVDGGSGDAMRPTARELPDSPAGSHCPLPIRRVAQPSSLSARVLDNPDETRLYT